MKKIKVLSQTENLTAEKAIENFNGGDAFRLQKLLGHSNIATTQIYVNMFGTDLQRDYDKFNPLDNLTVRGEKIKL